MHHVFSRWQERGRSDAESPVTPEIMEDVTPSRTGLSLSLSLSHSRPTASPSTCRDTQQSAFLLHFFLELSRSLNKTPLQNQICWFHHVRQKMCSFISHVRSYLLGGGRVCGDVHFYLLMLQQFCRKTDFEKFHIWSFVVHLFLFVGHIFPLHLGNTFYHLSPPLPPLSLSPSLSPLTFLSLPAFAHFWSSSSLFSSSTPHPPIHPPTPCLPLLPIKHPSCSGRGGSTQSLKTCHPGAT